MVSHGVYGHAPAELAPFPAGAIQFSPQIPGSASLENQAAGSLDSLSLLAPPGTVERRYALALALKALAPGGAFTILAPKDKGGSRLGTELKWFGCTMTENAKRHHRICIGRRSEQLVKIDEAIAEGAPRFVDSLGLWSQPGIFSWNRVDAGSALLLEHLPPLQGRGADMGCGFGVLSRAVLKSPRVERLSLIDIDRRAIDAARQNVDEGRCSFLWTDICEGALPISQLDFVVMNPPFHDGGTEDRSLGQRFIERASEMLRPGGILWLTANKHLPYEGVMKPLFSRIALKAEANGYKLFEAQK